MCLEIKRKIKVADQQWKNYRLMATQRVYWRIVQSEWELEHARCAVRTAHAVESMQLPLNIWRIDGGVIGESPVGNS